MSAWKTEDATIPKSAPFVPVQHVRRPVLAADLERVIRWNERPFYRRCWREREDYVPVWIDVQKLDAMLGLASNTVHVRFAGEDGILGKYNGVDRFVRPRRRTAIEMSRVEIEPACEAHPDRRIVYIIDGRHRFAWMRDHGAEALPVAAPASEASEIAQLVGTEDRFCRVTMFRIPEYDPHCLLTRAGRRAFAARCTANKVTL